MCTCHVKRFRGEAHRHLSRPPSNWFDAVAMSTSASSKQQVLAKCINEVPPNKGWWFRLPTISPSSQLPYPANCCMPHLGVPFGMTEAAMVKILLSMECLRLLCGKPHMNIRGWEDLQSEFKVTAFEWGILRLKSGSSTWYIQIGETQYPPTKLYSIYGSKA